MTEGAYSLLERQIETRPRAPFLKVIPDARNEDPTVTAQSFRTVKERVESYALGLESLDMPDSAVLGISLSNGPAFVYLLLAAARVGVPVACINTEMRGDGLDHILETAGIDVLVGSDAVIDETRSTLDDANLRGVYSVSEGSSHDRFPVLDGEEPPTPANVDRTDLAVLLHTSGTTGLPKWCRLSHAYLTRLGSFVADAFEMAPTDTVFDPLPLYHVNPLGYALFGSLSAGASLGIVPKFSVSGFWDHVRALDATVVVLHMAPKNMILRETDPEDADGHRVRVWFPADRELIRRFDVPKVVTGYGSTEAGGLTHVNKFTTVPEDLPDEEALSQYAGYPRRDVEVRIVDDDGRRVSTGGRGEILVRPTEVGVLFDGYEGSPEATVEAWNGLWYNTGDLGYRNGEGALHFVGRVDDAISHKGQFVNVDLVESALESASEVSGAAVVGIPDDVVGERVKATLVLDSPVEPATVLAAIEPEIPEYMLPEFVETVDALPRISGTEKIDRATLRERGVDDAWRRTEDE